MTDPIRAAALSQLDAAAISPSAEKRAQALSINDLLNELRELVAQVGMSRAGSMALTKLDEAGHWAMSHILNMPESGQAA